MGVRRKLLCGTLGLTGLALLIGIPGYAFRVGDCPKVDETLSRRYGKVLFISGGSVPKPKNFDDPAFNATIARIEEVANLYGIGLFPSVTLTGTPEDIYLVSRHLSARGIPHDYASRNGTNTTEDMRAGFETIGKNSKVLVVAGKRQINRAALVSRKYNLDPKHDDGYFGVKGTDMPNIARVVDREYIACVSTRFGLERLKQKIPFLE